MSGASASAGALALMATSCSPATVTARRSRCGSLVGGRLLNMETWTLSLGAPETRRGFFLKRAADAQFSSRRLRPMSFLMERLWFKIRKQPRPVLLHDVPEFVGHQRGVNIRPFDKAADARQLLWRKIIVSTHGADDSRTRLGFSQLLSWGGVLRPAPSP